MSAEIYLLTFTFNVLIVCGLGVLIMGYYDKSAKMAYFGAVVTLCGLVILAVAMAKLAVGG